MQHAGLCSILQADFLKNPAETSEDLETCLCVNYRLQLNVRRLRENVKRLTAQWAEQNPEACVWHFATVGASHPAELLKWAGVRGLEGTTRGPALLFGR